MGLIWPVVLGFFFQFVVWGFFPPKKFCLSLSSSSDISTFLSLLCTWNKLSVPLNFHCSIHRPCSQVTQYMIIKCKFSRWMLFLACFVVCVQRGVQVNRPNSTSCRPSYVKQCSMDKSKGWEGFSEQDWLFYCCVLTYFSYFKLVIS